MVKKSPTDLLNGDGQPTDRKTAPPAPVSVVIGHLMHEDGAALELTTRMNPAAAKATQVAFIFGTQIRCPITHEKGSPFMVSMNEQIQRLLVSYNGEGRKDLIAALQAGGQLPESYYNNKGRAANFQEVTE